MIKSIRNDLANETETVLAELNDCFKIISVSLVPSKRGVYITDNKVECCLQLESYLPKEVMCTKAAISIESYKRSSDRRTPVKGGHKTDLTVNSNVGNQCNSPKKLAQDIENDGPNFINE